MKRICRVCNKQFEIIPARINKAKYCSMRCSGIGRYADRKIKPSEYSRGIPRTKEEKRKISKNNARYWLGKKRPDISERFKGRKMSEEQRKKMSEAGKGRSLLYLQTPEAIKKRNANIKRGSNHPFWKGGVTSVYKTIRKSNKYKEWRTKVFKRDNWVCSECGLTSGNGEKVVLQADHIKSFSKYPGLRFDVDNGRTLCIDCHKKTNTYGGQSIRSIIKNNENYQGRQL